MLKHFLTLWWHGNDGYINQVKTKYKKFAAKVKVQCLTDSCVDGFLGKENFSDGNETDVVKVDIELEV